MNGIKVSVCCMTYNHVGYIGAALDGFMMQRADFPFEVIVHDDASTDGTADIVRSYENAYPGVVRPIYQQENQFSKGIRPNLRFIYPAARGEYLALCEGDDYWTDPMKLKKQVEFLENNPDYSLCYHDATVVAADGRVLRSRKSEVEGFGRDCSREELKRCFPASTQTMCFRNVVGDYPPEAAAAFGGDRFLCSFLGNYGCGKWMPEIGNSVYRKHRGGITAMCGSSAQMTRNAMTARMALFAYYNRIGDIDTANWCLRAVRKFMARPELGLDVETDLI